MQVGHYARRAARVKLRTYKTSFVLYPTDMIVRVSMGAVSIKPPLVFHLEVK